MINEPLLLLESYALLQIKHYLCDFLFQLKYQRRHKGTFLHPGGLVHAGLHGIGSIPAMLLLAPPIWLMGVLMAGEFVVHYALDWTKEQAVKTYTLTTEHYTFWQALGLDQMAHHLTYGAMLAALVMA